MEKEVIEMIAKTCDIDPKKIKKDTNLLADLEIDSLDFVDLVVAFEEKYHTQILDKDIKNLQTVEDIVAYMKEHV